MNPSLLIMSVYNESSLKWLEMQRNFIEKNTNIPFEIHYYLNNIKKFKYQTIGKSDTIESASQQHLKGLQECLKYSKIKQFKYNLILDSDCFPINNKYIDILDNKLSKYNTTTASVIRTENLTIFPHPCACFYKNPKDINFEIKKSEDLLGNTFDEVQCVAKKIFPMIRTNVVNPNLLSSAIYYDLFYHHGCGSRKFDMRSMPGGEFQYYENIGKDPEMLTKKLFSNPTKFIDTLMQVNPQQF